MKDFKVLIPDENYSILNFEHQDLPGVAVVNTALRDLMTATVKDLWGNLIGFIYNPEFKLK